MFVGLFGRSARATSLPDPGSTVAASLERSLDPLDVADEIRVMRTDSVLLVQSTRPDGPPDVDHRGPWACPRTGRAVVAWMRLDNRRDLTRRLALSGDVGDGALLLAAFERWGHQCTEHLVGDFSFAIHDPLSRSAFLARDHLGVRPLYYHLSPESLVVSTTAAAFHAIPGIRLDPSTDWMARYVVRSSATHCETPWPAVRKLAPAHQLVVDLGSSQAAEPTRYFAFDGDASDGGRAVEPVDRYRAALERAITCRVETTAPLGVESSGGLDSSTNLGFAARLWPGARHDLHAFAFVFHEHESGAVHQTSRLHGLADPNVFHSTRWAERRDELAHIHTVLGYPHEHGSAGSHEVFHIRCQELGVRTLLSGFGGDEGVTNEAFLSARELMARSAYVRLVRSASPRNIVAAIPGVEALRQRVAGRRFARTDPTTEDRLHASLLRPEAATAVARSPLLRSAADRRHTRVNDEVIDRLTDPHLSTRTADCVVLANARGVEYRWPLLDLRLIETYLSTPTSEKRHRSVGRYLHRRAIEGVVPHEIQWQPTKDMGRALPRDDVDFRATATRIAAHPHPAVAEVVDLDRLANLDPSDVLRRRELAQVNALDTWLWACH